MIDLLIITGIIVFITDLTDWWTSIKKLIWKFVFKNNKPYKEFPLKPFDCSLCSTFWIGLIYLLLTKSFTIPYIGYVALLAYLTPVIKDILFFIKDILTKAINTIYNILIK